jgi:integrase
LVLDIAVEAGARYDNPVVHIKRKKVRQKLLHLPSQEQFMELVTTIRKSDGGWAERCADLVEFLSYSGCRKGEAARVNGRDCDFEKSEITVLGDPATGTKNWEIRRVPMIPDMRRLLERLKDDRGEKEFAGNWRDLRASTNMAAAHRRRRARLWFAGIARRGVFPS